MVYESHWQFLNAYKPWIELRTLSIFHFWKANELRHAQIGKITMKPKA